LGHAVVDDDPSVRDALDSLFRSVGMSTYLFGTRTSGRAPSWQRSTSAAGLTRDDPSASGLGGVVVGFGAPIEANVHDVENSGGEVLTLRVDDECAPPYRGWRTFAI
jgi:hypothetical protein